MELFNDKKHPNTLHYVLVNMTYDIRCNRCGHVLLEQPNSQYPYQCMFCDENMFSIETHKGKPITSEEFAELCQNTLELLQLD